MTIGLERSNRCEIILDASGSFCFGYNQCFELRAGEVHNTGNARRFREVVGHLKPWRNGDRVP